MHSFWETLPEGLVNLQGVPFPTCWSFPTCGTFLLPLWGIHAAVLRYHQQLINFCLLNLQESPLINLLGQTSSLPWQLVGISSYQSIISYCNSHYPPSVVLAKDAASELIVKLLKISAGFGTSSDSHIHLVSGIGFVLSLSCSSHLQRSPFIYYSVERIPGVIIFCVFFS